MSAEQPVKSWPIRGYWIGFNPKTREGVVALQMDDDAPADLTFDNLPSGDVAALAENDSSLVGVNEIIRR